MFLCLGLIMIVENWSPTRCAPSQLFAGRWMNEWLWEVIPAVPGRPDVLLCLNVPLCETYKRVQPQFRNCPGLFYWASKSVHIKFTLHSLRRSQSSHAHAPSSPPPRVSRLIDEIVVGITVKKGHGYLQLHPRCHDKRVPGVLLTIVSPLLCSHGNLYPCHLSA